MIKRIFSFLLVNMFVGLVVTMAIAGPAPKTEICHIPPGNPDNFQTIVVSMNALPAHLAHGDLVGACDNIVQKSCQPGATQSCVCSDSTTAEQTCNDSGSGWEICECDNIYSYWNDPETNLTWQDPQKDAYKLGDEAPGQPDAVRYCEELVLGGYDDWRLPDIDELRTLIRGHDTTITGGGCSLTEGSKKEAMFDPKCSGREQYAGPGDGGCYWASELTGSCDKEDVADEFNKPLEFVSSTLATDDEFWVACILFDRGSISYNHIYSYADVRCVRDGPTIEKKCADDTVETCEFGETLECEILSNPGEVTPTLQDGVQTCANDESLPGEEKSCWGPCEDTSFTLSPPINDVSETCDQVKLTIKVPEEITDMAVIMGFLFQSETFTIPPMRPPDGGTDYNQVFDPVINLGTPLEMTIPACSYYRDRCIPSGDYRIWLTLLQSDGMPPWPKSGDYWIGPNDPPLTLQTGTQQIIEKEITLVPWE
jgi:hypothetical protein